MYCFKNLYTLKPSTHIKINFNMCKRLALREERKLRVFENKVLRRIFGSRRDEVTGGMEGIA